MTRQCPMCKKCDYGCGTQRWPCNAYCPCEQFIHTPKLYAWLKGISLKEAIQAKKKITAASEVTCTPRPPEGKHSWAVYQDPNEWRTHVEKLEILNAQLVAALEDIRDRIAVVRDHEPHEIDVMRIANEALSLAKEKSK